MQEQLPYLNTASSTEDRIIYLLVDADKKALELIFKNYGALLLNVILRIVKDKMMAEEVLQQALIKIWKNAQRYDQSKGALYTWLVSICRNAAIDYTRTKDFRLSKESERGEDLVNISGKASDDNPLDQMYMMQLLNQLPEVQRKLINMSYFEGYSHREIAEKLEMPLGTVKTRIRLGLKQLRAFV